MSHVLVTGGAGFIGSHLVEALLAAGRSVVALDDLSSGRESNLAAVREHPQFTFVRGSASDAALVREICETVDEVYHLAAAVGVALVVREPVESIERNLEPTRVVVEELCRRWEQGRPVKLFVASSSEVYGKNSKLVWNEDDDLVFGSTMKLRWSYGMSKALDEYLALGRFRSHGLPVVVGRFFNVVGPRQIGVNGMVLPRFLVAAKAGEPLIVHGDGLQTRCFAHVSQVVDAVMKLMVAPAAVGRVFNIGDDRPITIAELAREVKGVTDSSSPIVLQEYAAAFGPDFDDVAHRVPDLSRLWSVIGIQGRRSIRRIIMELAEEVPSD